MAPVRAFGGFWALISVDPAYRSLVTPTMAFWGGPFGIYTRTGEVVSANVLRGQVSLTPDPLLTVTAPLANGQLVPYPAPVLGAP